MLLALDIGNSTIVAGVFKRERLIETFQFPTKLDHTSDSLAHSLLWFLEEKGFKRKRISTIAVVSVIPSLNRHFELVARDYFGLQAKFLDWKRISTIQFEIDNPSDLGSDIIAGAVAAHKIWPNDDLIIIDLGTATTITAVTSGGDLKAVAILPGLGLNAASFTLGGVLLPIVNPIKPAEGDWPKNTKDSLRYGLYYGHVGSMREIIQEFGKLKIFSNKARVIGCGGFSSYFSNEDIFSNCEQFLVLRGLYELFN